MSKMELNLKTTFERNASQYRHLGHPCSRCASSLCKCCTISSCIPSIAHMTSGNLVLKNKLTLISAATFGKPMCCSCRRAIALRVPDSTRMSVTSLLCMPPSADKTLRARDEESAEVWGESAEVMTLHGLWFEIKPEVHDLARITYFSSHQFIQKQDDSNLPMLTRIYIKCNPSIFFSCLRHYTFYPTNLCLMWIFLSTKHFLFNSNWIRP